MGMISSAIRSGTSSAMNQMKSYGLNRLKNAVNTDALDLTRVQVPQLDTSLIKVSDVKLPANIDTYIPEGLTQYVKVPSEINGVKIPEFPDLSSLTSDVENVLSGVGFDTNALGIRSVSDILENPDLTALKQVQWDSPVDLENMPDLTASLDDFDLSSAQSGVDSLFSDVPSDIKSKLGSFDFSKYF